MMMMLILMMIMILTEEINKSRLDHFFKSIPVICSKNKKESTASRSLDPTLAIKY